MIDQPRRRPGPRNSLADVPGLQVGQAVDALARTGVTIVQGEAPMTAVVDVRGGAPGTINTDAIRPGGLVTSLDAIVLSGGSAFGLAAAAETIAALSAQGRGFAGWGTPIPLVAGAIIFDLVNGGDKNWGDDPPYRRLAREALGAMGRDIALGNAGAGIGATAGPLKGGIGSASAFDPASGVTVAALIVVNSLGGLVIPGTRTFYAWHLEQEGELGGQVPPAAGCGAVFETKRGIAQADASAGTNTVIGVVATDADLGQQALTRLAIAGQDGLAMAIRPAHTLYDGDTIFAASTGRQALEADGDTVIRLAAIAADVSARACMRAVCEAADLGDLKAYRGS